MTNAVRSAAGTVATATTRAVADDHPATYTVDRPNAVRRVGGWRPIDCTPPTDLPPAETAAAPVGDSPPDGGIDTVLAWVDSDPQRAERAWDAEVDGKRRISLLRTLTAVIGDGGLS